MFIIGGQTLIIAFGLLKNIYYHVSKTFFWVSKDVVFIFLYYIGTLQSQYKIFFFFIYLCILNCILHLVWENILLERVIETEFRIQTRKKKSNWPEKNTNKSNLKQKF